MIQRRTHDFSNGTLKQAQRCSSPNAFQLVGMKGFQYLSVTDRFSTCGDDLCSTHCHDCFSTHGDDWFSTYWHDRFLIKVDAGFSTQNNKRLSANENDKV